MIINELQYDLKLILAKVIFDSDQECYCNQNVYLITYVLPVFTY